MDTALPPPSARRRVARKADTSLWSSQAGPSRLPEFSSTNVDLNLADEPSRNLLDSFSDMHMDTPSYTQDTPADRLRAILHKLPPETPLRADAPPRSPSERDSDFDPLNRASSVTSSHRGTLQSLMNRALRPGGDTPQKASARRRRNSIDTSEVESSPRVQKVRLERAGAKGKRKSHSDEEVDTKTPTAIYDIFNEHTPNVSIDLHNLGSSQTSPPAATSTPQQQSLQSINSFLQGQTNLLDGDSDMQRGLQDFDSESDGPSPVAFPVSKKKQDSMGTIRPRSERSKSSPSTSTMLPHLNSSAKDDRDTIRQSTLSPTSVRHSRIPVSPKRFLPDSASSISGSSSNGSHVDHHERMEEMHHEHEHDLERLWNKPRLRALSKPSPALSSSRSRTYSTPTHPSLSPVEGRHSPLPGRQSPFSGRHSPLPTPGLRQKRLSISSSRSSSSASSRDDEKEAEAGEVAEVYHERERNWNSNHPTWNRHDSFSHSRSSSPTQATSWQASKSDHLHPSRTHSHDLSPRPHSVHEHARPVSPNVQHRRPISFPVRATSPLPPLQGSSSTSRSRSGISSTLKRHGTEPDIPPGNGHIRPKASLTSPSISSVTNSSRTGIPRLHHSSSNVLSPALSFVSRHGHTSRSTSEKYDGQTTDTDQEDIPQESTPTLKIVSSLPVDSSETNKRSSPSGSQSPSQGTHRATDETRLQKAVGSLHSPPLSPSSSSPATPPTPPASLPLFETTPAPPPKARLSKSQFQTPSPPPNLPSLSGPLSLSEEYERDRHNYVDPDTVTKTPRPPGGWAYTPARPNILSRTSSLPLDDDNASDQSVQTPMNTTPLSRAQSLPAQTPAPPGGWLMTPAQRKSVRFDSNQEFEESQLDSRDVSEMEESSMQNPLSVEVEVTGPTPPVSPSRSRRQARIRIVDEFGREETMDNSRSKSSIRIVDAMGRLVEDSVLDPETSIQMQSDEPFSLPKSRTEGMARVQTGLSNLEQLFDKELDRKPSTIDVARVQELEKTSSISRQQRRKLKSDIDANLRAVRKSMNEVMSVMESRSASQAQSQLRSHPTNYSLRHWAAWITFGVLVQIIILWVMYSMTLARAYELFITTYYDPFSPELYMYATTNTPGKSSTDASGIIGRAVLLLRQAWDAMVRPSHRTVLWGTT